MSGDLVAKRLADAEATIARGLTTFIDVGNALRRIRDERLYQDDYGTFEDYCDRRWGFTDRRARQLMDAANIVAELPTGTIVPVTETQARALAGLTPEIAAEVMDVAAESGKITEASIRDARNDIVGPAHVTTTSRTTESTKVEQDVDTETGEIIDSATIAGRAAADGRAPLPIIRKTAAQHERERIGQQNGWIARALKHLGGVQDGLIRARLVAEWDPANCDDHPSTVNPRNIREIANGLLSFADELEATRGLRVV
jgi:hypothetical protein